MTTKALSPPAGPRSPNHVLSHLRTLGDAGRIGFLLRYRDWQKQIDGHTKCPTDLLMQRYRTLALTGFEIREIALGDTDADRKLVLRHGTPFAQYPDGVLVSRQPIYNSLWHQDLATGRDIFLCVAHDASCTDVLIGKEPDEPLVFTLGKDGEFLAARGLDELNLGHDTLSIIDLASMTENDDNNRIGLGIENDTLIAHPQPGARTPFQSLDVALTGPCEGLELGVESPAHIGGEIEPLPCRSGGEHDLHGADIAYGDINVNRVIAYCDKMGRP
jgi:hypothetical protein